MNGRHEAGAILALTTALALAVAAPALAQYPPAEAGLTCNLGAVEPGTEITCNAGGFAPNSDVGIFYLSAEQKLATAKADGNGDIGLTVTIPRDSTLGTHRLEARGEDPDGNPHVLSFTLNVVRDLAKTGSGISLGVVLGSVAAVAVGTGMAVVARRRKTRTPV